MNALTFPFPDADRLAEPASTASDFAQSLADALTDVFVPLLPGLPLTVQVVRRDRALPLSARGRERSDGLALDLDIAPGLAEALASLRLGGSFASGDGAASAASVRRAADAIETALRAAADSLWPAPGATWQAAGAPAGGQRYDIALTVADQSFTLGFGFARGEAPVAASTAPRADAAWGRGMRALIGATGLPLRAILHERLLPLADAVRLRPGDVLPIETPRDVQLRIGTHRLARGTVAPAGDDGALTVTITNRRAALPGMLAPGMLAPEVLP